MFYSFKTEHAEAYGLEQAVMLHNFQFWIRQNRANNRNFHDKNWWTFNSIAAFRKIFPFWNDGKIRRVVKSLIDQKVLITGNYNKKGYDRTKWYAINPTLHAEMEIDPINTGVSPICQKQQMDLSKTANGFVGSDEPIPDSKQDSKQKIKEDDSSIAEMELTEKINEVLQSLNLKANSSYTSDNKQIRSLLGRLFKDGYKPWDCRRVVWSKAKEWLGTDRAMYIRPSTLFGPENFLKYFQAMPYEPEPVPVVQDPNEEIQQF